MRPASYDGLKRGKKLTLRKSSRNGFFMAIEIEKKYRLTLEQSARLLKRFDEIGAKQTGAETFEENVLYKGQGINPTNSVLRVRRADNRATFTYKERFAGDSAVKRQREDETEVSDADALEAILDALGYSKALIYEKRRKTWKIGATEVVLDELPFGNYVEIEGEEAAISYAENLLNLADVETEHATYPELASRYGATKGELVEARFS